MDIHVFSIFCDQTKHRKEITYVLHHVQQSRYGIDIVETKSYDIYMKNFKWNTEKNEILSRERGITFEEIVQRIESGAKVIETDHPNKIKYPNQKILMVDVEGYAYLVLCVMEKDEYFLKTIIPSKKATKKYLGG